MRNVDTSSHDRASHRDLVSGRAGSKGDETRTHTHFQTHLGQTREVITPTGLPRLLSTTQ